MGMKRLRRAKGKLDDQRYWQSGSRAARAGARLGGAQCFSRKKQRTAIARNAFGASSAVAELASAGAPVDAGKIAAIRAAIAEGRYPVDPEKIAARMIEIDLPLFDGE